MSISLVQNISVPDKSRKFVSCVRVVYKNKTQMLLNPSTQFFTDPRADNDNMRATNESYAIKMNIIVILSANWDFGFCCGEVLADD